MILNPKLHQLFSKELVLLKVYKMKDTYRFVLIRYQS